MNGKVKQCVIAAVFAVFSFGVAVAQVPDSLKNAWENPDLREKIDAGIKANRMGMFTLKFDGNVESLCATNFFSGSMLRGRRAKARCTRKIRKRKLPNFRILRGGFSTTELLRVCGGA